MHDLKAVSSLFDLRGDFVHGYSYGSGHINDTYCIWVDQAGQRIRYILQRVNHNVFKQPIPLMGTDESGAAGYENLHVFFRCW